MSAPLFDVFVVGSVDGSPAGQAKLASTLAARHGAPEPLVAKAIAAKTLRVGSNLERAKADALDQQLKALGAQTLVRAVDGTSAARPPALPGSGSGQFVTPGSSPTHTLLGGQAARTTATLPSLPTITSPNPFAPPPHAHPPAPDTIRSVRTIGGADPFAPPQAESERGLELDTEAGPSPGFRSGASVAGASAQMLTKMSGSESASGLRVEEGNPFISTCPIHEVEFDRRKASECSKCTAVGKAGMPKRAGGKQVARLRDNPARRAFMGLAFALFLGLVPAAYSALHLGASEVARLRAQQEELSRKPGTAEVLKQFDELDTAVDQARTQSAIHTLVLWVLVSSGAMALWYRLT